MKHLSRSTTSQWRFGRGQNSVEKQKGIFLIFFFSSLFISSIFLYINNYILHIYYYIYILYIYVSFSSSHKAVCSCTCRFWQAKPSSRMCGQTTTNDTVSGLHLSDMIRHSLTFRREQDTTHPWQSWCHQRWTFWLWTTQCLVCVRDGGRRQSNETSSPGFDWVEKVMLVQGPEQGNLGQKAVVHFVPAKANGRTIQDNRLGSNNKSVTS